MADLDKIVKDLSSLTVIEAAELSKLLEEKWGVSAAAPVAVAAASAATSDEAAEEMGWDIEGEPTQEQVAAFFKFARERAMKKLAAEEERRRRREGAHGDGLLHFDGADVRVERARVGHEDGRKGDRGVPQTAVRA